MATIIRKISESESSFGCNKPVAINNPYEGHLKELRSVLQQSNDPFIIHMDDEYLMRFLRTGNFNIEKAAKLVKKHKDFVLGNKEALSLPSSYWKHCYESGVFMVLKKRDEEGRKVIIIKARNWKMDEIKLDFMMVAMYHLLDTLLECELTQSKGIVVIADCSGMGFLQITKLVSQFTPKQVMRLIHFYLGGYPVKIKSVHAVSAPMLAVPVYAGVKYLLTEKMRQRIHVYHSGPKCLHKYFNKDFLPQSLEGSCPENSVEDVKLIRKCLLRKSNII